MYKINRFLSCALVALMALATTAQAQKMTVPNYNQTGTGQVKFYDLSTPSTTTLGTLNTTVSGTNYHPNGVAFYGTDMFVAYDEPTSDGFLHYKNVQVSGGTVTFSAVVKITTSTVTTEIVVDASGNLYVGCGFGANRGVKKITRDGSGNYSFANSLSIPTATNPSTWYNGIGGLAFDGSGNLFATDLADNRILKWTAAAGTPVSFSCTSPTNCQFNNTANTSVYLFSGPEGLVFDAGGNLWVANNNDFNNNLNTVTGGSLVRLNASLVNTNGGTINAGNATIYSTALAKFGGMA